MNRLFTIKLTPEAKAAFNQVKTLATVRSRMLRARAASALYCVGRNVDPYPKDV